MVAGRLFNLLFWSAAAVAIVLASLPSPVILPGNPDDKLLHMLAFSVLAMLATLAFPQTRVSVLLLGLGASGGAIELIQSAPQIGREASWLDWLSDLVGAGLVLVTVGAGRALCRRRRLTRSNSGNLRKEVPEQRPPGLAHWIRVRPPRNL